MQRSTIDFGIDLGTTNSAISVINGGKVETLKNGLSEVLPSCVYIDKKGTVHVGAGGKPRLEHEKSTGDVQIEFKRTMGTDKTYCFETVGILLSSEDLSAKVLAELRSTAASRFNSDPPLAAVITIPAMFESPQRTATAKAVKLAGFEHVELLQEPVAAAVAAGFQSDADKAFWVVFDFGGGTFDALIVSIRDGQLSVIEHAGDNFLGGANLDWAIVEHILLPHLAEKGDVDHLTRGAMDEDLSVRAQMYKLKTVAENIKASLSKQDEVQHYADDFLIDASGESLDIDVGVTRDQLNGVISDLVDRSVSIVRDLIVTAKLKPSNIAKILLVGGTTFIPLVREKLAELGIDIDCSHDPMTIVSRGAAIYAASRKMPEDISQAQAPESGLLVQLEYISVVKSDTSPVGGKLTMADGGALPEGLQLSIKRSDGGWESGLLSVEAGGLFFTDVVLVHGEASEFRIIVRDSSGVQIDISPASFTVTHGVTIEGASLPQTIRLCRADGSTAVLIRKGTQLPAKVNKLTVQTIKPLTVDSDDELRIPLAEGDEHLADRNLEGSVVIIRGTDIERSLPDRTLIEITGEVDVSGVFTARCYVEDLDEIFVANDNLLEFDPERHKNDLQRIRNRNAELKVKVDQADSDKAASDLRQITADGRLDAIEQSIDEGANADDRPRLGEARNEMVQIQKKLDAIEDTVAWPAILAEYNEDLEEAHRLVQQHGEEQDRSELKQLEVEGQLAVDEQDSRMLKRASEHLTSFNYTILGRQPGFWVAILGDLANREHQFQDLSQAQSLLAQGNRAVQARDVETMKSVVRQLWSLLPLQVAAESKAGAIDSSVM